MPNQCPYCHSPVKESDRFCIYCGKPLLTNLPDSKNKKDKNKKKSEEKNDDNKVIEHSELESLEEAELEKNKLKNKKKEKDNKEEDLIEYEIKPLSENVKEQIQLYVERKKIKEKMKILDKKLAELQKSINPTEFELNLDYKDKILKKIEAVKTIAKELKEKDAQIKTKLESPFIVKKLTNEINKKIYQLKNLSKEFKLKKIRDPNVFKKLKEKYKSEKIDLEVERQSILSSMEMWAGELKAKRDEIATERRYNKARYAAKEISEDEFKEIDKKFEKEIKEIELTIETIQELSKC
ncbi:MAG: zinc-ribbon domain-containing protein [Promethearchaeota archaeon]